MEWLVSSTSHRVECVIARRGAAKRSCQDGHGENSAGEPDYGFKIFQRMNRVAVYVMVSY